MKIFTNILLAFFFSQYSLYSQENSNSLHQSDSVLTVKNKSEVFDEINSDSTPNIPDYFCVSGTTDAQKYHGKKGTHFILGALFGPIAIIGTASIHPEPEYGKRTAQLSENKEYFNEPGYRNCYSKQAKKQLIGMNFLGWATWIIIFVVSQMN